MQPLLEPNLPGYGIFSLSGLSLVLICILLLNLVHPLGLVANRAGDALGGLIRLFQKTKPSEMHGLDSSTANSLSAGFLLRGEALIPGYAMFVLGISSYLFDTQYQVAQSLVLVPGAAVQPAWATLAAATAFSASAIFDQTRYPWATLWGFHTASALNWIAYGFIVLGFVLSGFSPIWTISAVAIAMSARILCLILGHTIRMHGIGAALSAPILLFGWGIVTSTAALIGPFMRLLDRLVDQPGYDGVEMGIPRESEIEKAEIAAPRSTAQDSLLAMIHPR